MFFSLNSIEFFKDRHALLMVQAFNKLLRPFAYGASSVIPAPRLANVFHFILQTLTEAPVERVAKVPQFWRFNREQ